MNQTLRNRVMGVLTSKAEPQSLSEINSNTQIMYSSKAKQGPDGPDVNIV